MGGNAALIDFTSVGNPKCGGTALIRSQSCDKATARHCSDLCRAPGRRLFLPAALSSSRRGVLFESGRARGFPLERAVERALHLALSQALSRAEFRRRDWLCSKLSGKQVNASPGNCWICCVWAERLSLRMSLAGCELESLAPLSLESLETPVRYAVVATPHKPGQEDQAGQELP